MNNIIIISSSFPYYPGEEFLETEIQFYNQYSKKVIIIPIGVLSKNNKIRPVPENIIVENKIYNWFLFRKIDLNSLKKVWISIKVLFHSEFYKEIGNISLGKDTLNNLFTLFSTIGLTYELVKKIDKVINKNKIIDPILIYSYWLDVGSYAGCIIKKRLINKNIKVVSRAHGYDAMKEQSPYTPLKIEYTADIDNIFPISNYSKEALINDYKFNSKILSVFKLGIKSHPFLSCENKEKKTIKIVSCSRLWKLKRINLIIDLISEFLLNYPDFLINWDHIGDGDLIDELKSYAKNRFEGKRIFYRFLGYLKNTEVMKLYEESQYNFFITTSKIEGIPVSIMEALSFGIPVIATSVGGIPEIISLSNGILLNSEFKAEENTDVFLKILEFNSIKERERIKNDFYKEFSAEKNYIKFIDTIAKI